jgi:hypothetical protein
VERGGERGESSREHLGLEGQHICKNCVYAMRRRKLWREDGGKNGGKMEGRIEGTTLRELGMRLRLAEGKGKE